MVKWVDTSHLKSSLLHNSLNRLLGLEIELSALGEMLDNHPHRKLNHVEWQWVRDGSLTAGGMEMVLSPLGGDAYLTGMECLVPALISSGCEVDESCGLHVHVGAGDFSAFDLRALLLGFLKIQSDIYRLVSPSRKGSRYCLAYDANAPSIQELRAATQTHEIKQALLQLLYSQPANGDVPLLKREKYRPCRYYGLNLHSWMQRGTVEFRQCEGTLSPERLIIWPLFCGWMVEILHQLHDSEIEQLQGLEDLCASEFQRGFSTIKVPTYITNWIKKEIR